MIYDVIILGAGASGMMCAAQINEKSDLNVLIVEGNEKAGKKLKISGGGKCNITNVNISADNYLGDEQLIESVFAQFSKDDLLRWLAERGLVPVIRKKQYYFCEKSSDEIINILKSSSGKSHYHYRTKVLSLVKESDKDGLFRLQTDKGEFQAKHVVVATGAKSYASIGASEIGLKLAEQLGHSSKPFMPALAGLTLQPQDFWMKELSGISLFAHISINGKSLKEDMLLTHRGLSGPVVLSASLYWKKGEVEINFLPEIDLRAVVHNNRKLLSTALNLPKRFTQALLDVLNIKDKPCSSYKEEELKQLEDAFHHYMLAPAGTYGFAQAEVCKGGVKTDDINSWTLESNIVENLYFIGEVLDVTGELGGYNFQWAFSSAVSVANNIIEK